MENLAAGATVAANPYHAEVIALFNGTRHLQKIRNKQHHHHRLWRRDELGPTPVFEDNQAACCGLRSHARVTAGGC